MKTKWEEFPENEDGSGEKYYQCQCPQPNPNGNGRMACLYKLCYMPSENKLWFWDELKDGSSVKMVCTTWEDAETVKAMLTTGKSHWMKAPNMEVK